MLDWALILQGNDGNDGNNGKNGAVGKQVVWIINKIQFFLLDVNLYF